MLVLALASGCGDSDTARLVYVNVVEATTSSQQPQEQDADDAAPEDHYEILVIFSNRGHHNPTDLFWSSRLGTSWDDFLKECSLMFAQQCGVEMATGTTSPGDFKNLVEASLMPPVSPRYNKIQSSGSWKSQANVDDHDSGIVDNLDYARSFQVYSRRN